MLSLERSNGSYILIHANGWLGAADYEQFETEFTGELGRWTPPVPLLLDMRGFRGWTPPGFLRDLLWDVRHRSSFSKIAVVGDARWHRWVTVAGGLLFRGQMKYFPATGLQPADQWLREAVRRT
jgi:hypothetical protein